MLLPALEEGGRVQAAAVAVLELMVVEHKAHTAPALARMPPLPTHPALARVNAELAARQVRFSVCFSVCAWASVSIFLLLIGCIHLNTQGTGNALDHLRLLIDAL